MRGQSKVEFPFDLDIAVNGEIETVREIHLAAPGLRQMDLHYEITSTMKGAAIQMAFKLPPEMLEEHEKKKQEGEPEPEDKKEDDGEESSALSVLQMSMDPMDFVHFMKRLKKVLTKAPKLAWVEIGDQKIMLRDDIWDEIHQKGGMFEIDRLFDKFLDFFGEGGQEESVQ